MCIVVSESWEKDPRGRSGDSAGGAGRLLGEVWDEVFRRGFDWRVNTVWLGGTVGEGAGPGCEELVEGATEELGVTEEFCGGLGMGVVGDSVLAPGTKAAMILDICRRSWFVVAC
jgi:hypothetical protein